VRQDLLVQVSYLHPSQCGRYPNWAGRQRFAGGPLSLERDYSRDICINAMPSASHCARRRQRRRSLRIAERRGGPRLRSTVPGSPAERSRMNREQADCFAEDRNALAAAMRALHRKNAEVGICDICQQGLQPRPHPGLLINDIT